MVQWQDQLIQFSSKIFRIQRKQASSTICPLCQMPHGKQEQSDDSCPSADDDEGWKQYWADKGQPWRTQPAISPCRQYELSQRWLIPPDEANGIYPAKGIPLNRADVEWLLATHENGRGPIDWNDEQQRTRRGLDLRGAMVSEANLSYLPLARLQGGFVEFLTATEEKRIVTVLTMKETILSGAHLSGADLSEADLGKACLIRARLNSAVLERVHLDGVILSDEKGVGPHLVDIQWGDTNLAVAKWSQVRMLGDEDEVQQKMSFGREKNNAERLEDYERAVRANRQLAVVLRNQGLNEVADGFAFRAQVLQWHVIQRQRFEQLIQIQENLQKQEDENQSSHERKGLSLSQLAVRPLRWLSSKLSEARLNPDDHLVWGIFLLILQLLSLLCLLLLYLLLFMPFIALIVLVLTLLFLLQWLCGFIVPGLRRSKQEDRCSFLQIFAGLLTSTYQLFVKTLEDHASSAFSLFLNVLAGYGYRPVRTLCWYIVVVLGFAIFYFWQAPVIKAGNPDIRLDGIGALILSITAFHGRGLFLGGEFGYDNPVTMFGAVEAIIGLLIELSFVATFTGRFFRR